MVGLIFGIGRYVYNNIVLFNNIVAMYGMLSSQILKPYMLHILAKDLYYERRWMHIILFKFVKYSSNLGLHTFDICREYYLK